jgi:RsiW-degrading membrane proteinase PrsW (M82 family)
VAPLGLLLLAVTPSAAILVFFEQRYKAQVFRSQMSYSFLSAIIYMLPLLAVVGVAMAVFSPLNTPPTLTIFFTAFVFAALAEEVLKYLAVRAVVAKDFVADPGALIVYALAAANGFACVENILYVLSTRSVFVAVARALIAVPGHSTTGLMIGAALGQSKFVGKEDLALWRVIAVPVVVHGSYNFSLMMSDHYGELAHLILAVHAL